MPDTYEESLRLLGLRPGASEQAIKDAYRDLVKVWHPDRFGSDARLRAKAQEKLKEVNAAFEQLRGYRASDVRRPRESARPADRASDFTSAHVPESSVEPPNYGRTRSLLNLLLKAALIGIVVGMALFTWRSRVSERLSPPDELNQTPGSSTPVPSAPQPASRPEAPRSAPVGAPRESVAASTTGSLIVTSRPMGARVLFDGRAVGETPIAVTEVTPGEHHIELTLDGNAYQPWSSSVVVTAGHEEKLLAVMTPTGRGR